MSVIPDLEAELTVDLDEPFSLGSSTTPGPLPPDQIGINLRSYVLDTKSGEYRREGIEVLQQRNTTSNRDVLLLPQNVWRHQDESWHLGMGQRNLDREDAMQYRYSRAFGINPWTKYQISLLNQTSKLQALATPNPCFMHVHNGWLVAVVGSDSYWWETPASAPVTLAVGGTIISTTYDGDAVICLDTAGKVWRLTSSTVKSEFTYTPPAATPPIVIADATFIAYVKDYLLVGIGNRLLDITLAMAATPLVDLVYTSPVTGFTWKAAAEGNTAIYLIGGSGDKHVVHRLAVQDDGTGLGACVVAASLPDGELGTGIGGYLGFVFLGSNLGARMAIPANASGDLLLGALIPTTLPVYNFEGQGQYVWVTGSYINPVSDTGPVPGCPTAPVSGLYRADLTAFTTSESTPAFATDLYAVDNAFGVTRSVVTWVNKRVFAVDGHGIYMETDVKIPAGWLEPGRVSFSVEDIKTGLYVQGKWEPLRGTVAFDLTADDALPKRVLNWSIRDSVRSGNVPMDGLQFSRMEARYVLMRDTTDTHLGPVLSRFELRARPAKGSASRWFLPIILSESYDLNGVILAMNVNDEFDRFMGLVEKGTMFPLQEGRRVYQVVAVDFKWVPEKLTTQGDGWQGTYVLVVEEVK